MRIFIAGATGVVGRRLIPMLLAAGHSVTGATRRPEKVSALKVLGAAAVVLDVFDRDAVFAAVTEAKPDAIVHQLTDLPAKRTDAAMEAARPKNARLRIEGTASLMAAASRAGVPRVVAQSVAFAYAPGALPHAETDPLDPARAAVIRLEELVLGTPGIAGLALRYGYFYGADTWSETAGEKPSLHIDAAARAALLALGRGEPGAYNIADDDGAVAIGKARAQLGFDPAFRL